MSETDTNTKAVIDLVERLDEVKVLTALEHGELGQLDAPIIVLPSGKTLHSTQPFFDKMRLRPARRIQSAVLTDVRSFIAHVNRYRDSDPDAQGAASDATLYADKSPQRPGITAYYNDHDAIGLPGFGDDKASYSFPISKGWRAWVTERPRTLTQAAFAEFLEDHLHEMIEPGAAGKSAADFAERYGIVYGTPGRMLELSKGLSVRVASSVKNFQNLASGEVELFYQVTHEDQAGGALKIPGALLLQISVFEGGPVYQIPVRVRYRVNDGKVTWAFEPHRSDLVYEDAITEVCETIARETKVPLFYGTR